MILSVLYSKLLLNTRKTRHQSKELKLNALIHGVNAAGLLGFNPVEIRMNPLSHNLAGVTLPHDQCGAHLIVNGVTANAELET